MRHLSSSRFVAAIVVATLLVSPAAAQGAPGVTILPGCGANPDGSFVLLGGSPDLGGSLTFGVDNPLGTQAPGASPLLVLSATAQPTLPCGLAVPGKGMAGGAGEFMLGAPLPVFLSGPPWTGPGNPAPIVIGIPSDAILAGVTFYVQGILSDAGPGYRLAQAAAVTLADDGPLAADTLLVNGLVYTVDDAQTVASALAIRDGEIVFVGDDAAAAAFQGPLTEVVDLEGRMAMPGIHDVHVHILEAFVEASGTCVLQLGVPFPNYIPVIQACAPNQVGTDEWVLGYGHSIFDMHQFIEDGGSPRAILDAAVPDKPVAILEITSHSVWVNSLALQVAGIDASTPDPTGGVILKDAQGQPNGVLVDAAGEIVMDIALEQSAALDVINDAALAQGLAFANRNGITSLCDARVYWKRGHLDAWERARDAGSLSVRAVLGLWAYPYETDDAQQIADLASMYSNDPESLLRVSQVKLYSDGEIEHTTAALLSGYQLDPFFFDGQLTGTPNGLEYFDEARLTEYVTQLEAVGFDMHIHTIGDRGVREALDAIEAADIANGGAFDGRHRLTHVSLVRPADVPRFAALDVTADFQPLGPSVFNFLYSIYLPFGLIQQAAEQVGTLHAAGARVVLSSDYDVGSLSPFAGMETALSLGAESLPDIGAAIRAYTIDPAYVMRQEDRVGTLEVGKRADVIVLDRDITSVPVAQIGDTQVLLTLLDGEEVWRAPGF